MQSNTFLFLGAKGDFCSNILGAKQHSCSNILVAKQDFSSNCLGVFVQTLAMAVQVMTKEQRYTQSGHAWILTGQSLTEGSTSQRPVRKKDLQNGSFFSLSPLHSGDASAGSGLTHLSPLNGISIYPRVV